jgi:hypothetical protein
MYIRDLFSKDINRRINPAVVVSEMDEYSVNQEIEEYVFTPAITRNMYKFLNALANKKEGKTGVWISGYYGSGKSHFIKYLYYCLQEQYSPKAFEMFKESLGKLDPLDEPNIGLVTVLQNRLAKLTLEEIIFNIDAVSDNNDSKERITRVLLNQLNQFRGYNNTNIALALYLEKPLDKSGVFNQFKESVKSTFNETWEGNQIRFSRMYLDKIIDIAAEFDPNIDKQALKSTIMNKSQDYTIEFLIAELKDYLQDKTDEHRLIFLIDEVSQYIGSDTTLLLNLQTIVEEIGSKIGPRVWVVCTAQQELSNLINNTDDQTEDFGKIFGRFETMISLESQDAAFITKKRVLDKKSEGIGLLNDYYKANKGGIENQFVLDHDLYQNFENRNDFTLTYPFIPYQFRLVSDVFESFSNVGYVGEGVKNTERAILGITHYTAKLCKDKEVGYFVPFDLFFNEQLMKNLTHLARNILDRAYKIKEVQSDEFARRVVNSLFMISNLGESKSINFPASVENISLLMLEAVDTPKQEMQDKVEKVLNNLVDKNIIQMTEGKYRFLKEDEIEVAQMIKNTPLPGEYRLEYFYEDIIQRIVKPEPQFSFGSRNFRISIQIDDKLINQKGDFNLKFSVYETSELLQIAHTTPTNDMVVGISEWFKNDNDIKTKVLDYCRTKRYIGMNTSIATGTRLETLNNFKEANTQLLKEILAKFGEKFMQTSMVSKNQIIKAEELNTNTPASRFQFMVKRHMEEVYNKHHLAADYATNNATLVFNAGSKQGKLFDTLSPAEEEVNTKLSFEGESPVVGDIVKHFEKAPYGWKDITTLDVLLHLAKKGIRRFEWRGEEVDPTVFADKAINSKERDAITIHKEKTHSSEEVSAFIHAINNEIFAESLITSDLKDFKLAVDEFKAKLKGKITNLNTLKESYDAWAFSVHLKHYYNDLSEIYTSRNNDEVLQLVLKNKTKLSEHRDNYKMLEEFIDNNFNAYEDIASFIKENRSNCETLDEVMQVKATELTDYFKNDTEPWDKFPQIKKAYKELHKALSEYIEELRTRVMQTYEQIFREIEEHKNLLDIKEPNLTGDPKAYLANIKKEKQVAKLEIMLLKADDFRATSFKVLDDYNAQLKAKASGKDYQASTSIAIAKEMPPTTIETPEQLDDYLNRLREKLMVKLAKNKKLFIN